MAENPHADHCDVESKLGASCGLHAPQSPARPGRSAVVGLGFTRE
jgi:hypothetical protein